jgi:tetratricopeptide (TPR) repeat protein
MKLTSGAFTLVVLLLTPWASTPIRAEAAAPTEPAVLLAESFSLALQRVDHGDSRTVALLRLGATMRLAGMKQEAVAVLEECLALNEKDSDPEYERGEVKIELAREFLLLGRAERARSLLTELKARESDLVGQEVLARAALELGEVAEAERALRAGLAMASRPGRRLTTMGNPMLCSLARLALVMEKPELAGEAVAVVKDETWKSVMLGDQAEALAERGRSEDALRLVGQATDPHLAVLAYARVAAARVKRHESAAAVGVLLQQAAAKIKGAEARDFALRLAAGKLAAAGEPALVAQIALDIQSPATRLLALCPAVEPTSF